MKMPPKATFIEACIVIASGVTASSIGNQLADHHVSTAAIVATIVSVLTVGLYLSQQIGQGLRTTLYTCPTKGCGVTIRAKNTSADELNSLRVMATDQSKHGGA